MNDRTEEQEHRVSDALALGGTVVIGAMLAAQARINGDLGKHTGAVVAALISFGVGTVILIGAVATSAHARSGWRRLSRARGRTWWYLGGVAGAAVVGSSAGAVPEVGVSLVTVLLVAGATIGGLCVDAVGLGPGGRVHATLLRTFGTALAIIAVCIGALGQHASFRPALLALVGIAGVASAGQQAANGQLRQAAADARVAALISFAVGVVSLFALTALLSVIGHLPQVRFPTQPALYVGGLLGVVYIVVAAALVHRLGVLRLTLGTVSGQVIGALLIDAIAPTPGLKLTAATVTGAVLTLVAVAITVRSR
ncbi:MAG: DMT family transporter [Actinomycetes bacterium]